MECPYCGSVAVLMDSKAIYGRSYGWAWVCARYPRCDSYVGCHKGTKEPLGRLADKELRVAKIRAHDALDGLWKKKRMTRKEAYGWLAERLGVTRHECHIGMFDVQQCLQVIAALKDFSPKPLPPSLYFTGPLYVPYTGPQDKAPWED